MLQAPPSRYKIIERDRRLVTIDTLSGDAMSIAPVPTTSAPVENPTMRSTSPNMRGPVRGEVAMGAARTGIQAAPSNTTGSPRGALLRVAGLFPGARISADDRLTVTTATSYDEQAPREMRLTAAKTNALGAYVIMLAILLVLAITFVIATEFFGLVVLIFIALKFSQPANKNIMRYIISDAEDAG